MIEPSLAPVNVEVIAVTSSVIQVSWEEVPIIDQNGVITQYEVEYNQTTFDSVMSPTNTFVDSTVLSVNLIELEEYVDYSIRVKAYTSVGPGPYSEVVMATTLEDCKLTYMGCLLCA